MTRLPRKSSVLAALASPGAPRVFSPSSLQTWLADRQLIIPARTLSMSLIEWTQSGAMDRINSRVYLNGRARPRPTLDEAASHLRPGAVVSLQRALAHVGVLNDPSPWITATVSSADTTKVGKVETDGGTFRFATLPEAMVVRPGHALYQDAIDSSRPWMATPEKALLDWLHLSSTPRGASSWPLPSAFDWNINILDQDRLDRLANGLGVSEMLFDFQGKIGLGALDPSPRRYRGPR